MYTRLAKAFYFITVVFFIIAFLYIYASLPKNVAYEVSGAGQPIKQINQDTFFFVSIAVFVVLNLLIIIPAKMVENQTLNSFRKLFRIGDTFREYMVSWIYAFAGIFNINLAILVFYILKINVLDGSGGTEIAFIFYLGPLFLLLWIIALFILLGKKIKQMEISRLGETDKNY